MQLPVLVEPLPGGGFQAVSGFPSLRATGATAEEALKALADSLSALPASGARLMTLEVPPDNPWLQLAGIYKDDPYLEEWRQAMMDYRKEVENDPDYL